MRKGDVAIEAVIDLHHMTVDAAFAALCRFVPARRSFGDRCVLVITGKGNPALKSYGHDAPGVLRRLFPDWIAKPPLRAHIAGYAQAHQRDGGAGAWYLFLKRPDPPATPSR